MFGSALGGICWALISLAHNVENRRHSSGKSTLRSLRSLLFEFRGLAQTEANERVIGEAIDAANLLNAMLTEGAGHEALTPAEVQNVEYSLERLQRLGRAIITLSTG
jgi:hypothetical protein